MKTTEEQLIYIESMISHAKGEIGESSIFFLLWGYLAVSAAVIQYILLQFTSFAEPTLVWPVFMGIGGILSLVISKRKKAKEGSRTYIARFIGFLWLGVISTLLLAIVIMGIQGWNGLYPIIILLYGLGTFVSGGILKFLPLKIGGICCWIIAVVAVWCDFPTQTLLIALALLLSYIIPGHILSAKKKDV